MRNGIKRVCVVLLAALFAALLWGCEEEQKPPSAGAVLTPVPIVPNVPGPSPTARPEHFSYEMVPEYAGEPWVYINDNVPFFSETDYTTESYARYAPLDALGRCGAGMACVGVDIMPTEPRGQIGMIRPSGWETTRYDDLVDGKYLYNRCHIIGYQLAGENANIQNLITGTRYLNTKGMLSFENKVAAYVTATEDHVLYRVTPVFLEDDLLARGVLMEASSVEDRGEGLSFCVYAYNVQPYIDIDYASGHSKRAEDAPDVPPQETPTPSAAPTPTEPVELPENVTYVGNTNSMRFHRPDCESVGDTLEKNRYLFTGTREEIMAEGYTPCSRCKP